MGASVSASSHSPQPEPVFLHPSLLGGPSNLSPLVAPEHLSKEKKRKSTTLSTLRRRLIRKRRTSKSFDHAQMFRAYLSSWTKKEMVALVEGYETSTVLKELSSQSDLARLEANSCRQDLGELFESKYFADLNLIYQGVTFQVHRALLAARCPFFRELLNDVSVTCSEVMVDIDIAGMSVQMFSDLLKYLYTGELSVTEKSEGSLNILYQLSEQFGIPNPLEQDLKFLLDTGMYSDAVLAFLSNHKHYLESKDGASCVDDFEMPCHTVVLASRSPFFRNVIRRHFERQTSTVAISPARIILDETIIPRRFAKIIVQALYQDLPDFGLLIHNHVGSVNDLQAGLLQKDPLEETMQLYEIAKFLEMDALAQSCEDAVVETLSLETVVPILQWSRQPHGSQWARRQALAFLREEFTAVASSSTLFQLDKDDLVEIIQSDFLQASELEVLQAVLRWGEQHLLKRMEEREPNLVSQTAHSVSRRGLKRRDLCDVELREILGDILCHVRTDHILPSDNEVFLAAIKRGLVCSLPPHMLGDEAMVGPHQKASSWVRGTKGGSFVGPRLFTPYVEEAKALLEEEYGQEQEVSHAHKWQISHIPDALYMVEKPFPEEEQWYEPANLDVVKGMILDNSTFKLLKKREEDLRKSNLIQKAYTLTRNPSEVSRLVLLRVVREFGLPDLTIDILHKSSKLCPEEVPEMPEHKAFPQCAPLELNRPAPPQQVHRRFCSEHHLSGIIPDIAMATSLMGRMQLLDCDITSGPERMAPVPAKRRGKEAGSRLRKRFLYWPRSSDSADCT